MRDKIALSHVKCFLCLLLYSRCAQLRLPSTLHIRDRYYAERSKCQGICAILSTRCERASIRSKSCGHDSKHKILHKLIVFWIRISWPLWRWRPAGILALPCTMLDVSLRLLRLCDFRSFRLGFLTPAFFFPHSVRRLHSSTSSSDWWYQPKRSAVFTWFHPKSSDARVFVLQWSWL